MKLKFTLLFLFIFSTLSAQSDSTTISFFYLERDQALLNKLNDIQYIGISCKDKDMKGKRFILSIDEYKEGIKTSIDTTNMKCKDDTIQINAGDKIINYIINFCDKMSFSQDSEEFKIRLAGKLQEDSLKLIIDYEAISMTNKLYGKDSYSLRDISCSPDSEIRVPLYQKYPLLAYTPPFETGSGGLDSYCLLGMEEVDKWFEKFNVKHYYIINLKIE
ncbi:MAG: hypothetical protein E6767_14545 [Dysgonomonas sp.]|nr:hypothetical protein [Dysgonomonas sp.]